MKSKKITTERLYLLPFTIQIAKEVMDGQFTLLTELGLKLGKGWPDDELKECLPRIIENLELVAEPSGFESWMVIDKASKTLIGDAGFKGLPTVEGIVDLGYAIIAAERRKGYAAEAAEGLIKWAFKQSDVKMITARCAHVNEASTKTLTHLGFYQKFIKEEMVHWFLLREPQKKLA
ncbi:GNAT family N-acetyltransferase [Pedobacter gandavensis]|uniref:GNAT family N-acetyltransferase n=1 Tax=Pedobacter gandavensis TaxID=2679963 RepID=A0ABR6EUT7_9SPHI|nr:GNAT family N-acetyltransferase [Pedobacter gandavensis]MBB2149033.1 GNAT family N-acetyltransferase [Pedobacter gandavensis]